MNLTKSHGLWLGSWKSRRDLPLGIAWSSESIKILGLTFTPQYFKTVSINWRLILEKVRGILAVWKRRDMSSHDRVSLRIFTVSFGRVFTVIRSGFEVDLSRNVAHRREFTTFSRNNSFTATSSHVSLQDYKHLAALCLALVLSLRWHIPVGLGCVCLGKLDCTGAVSSQSPSVLPTVTESVETGFRRSTSHYSILLWRSRR